MTFYLAAKYSYRMTVLQIAALLTLTGHQVSGRWLTGVHTETAPEAQSEYAVEDLQDIDKVDALAMFQFPAGLPEPSSGRHVEFGYALAKQKRVMLIGKSTSVFHYLPRLEHFETLQEFLDEHANKARWDGPT